MNNWVIGESATCKQFCGSAAHIHYAEQPDKIETSAKIDAIIDLGYINDNKRKQYLQSLGSTVVFINDVIHPLGENDDTLVRVNGWNGFLENKLIEASVINDALKLKATEVFALFDKQLKFVKDKPGFISPRIIATVINEAYHTWGEGIATKDAIDTAMLYGTNYPQGPFQWAIQIGIGNVYQLLKKLTEENSLYQPASSLLRELSIENNGVNS